MTGRACLALVVTVAGWLPGAAAADEWGPGNARVRLVASADRAEPSQPTLLGVHFDIKPGWHIYWKNPGGAGMATEITWRLPAGVDAGETQWPVPIAFVQSGEIPGYGYENEVVLAAEVGGTPLVGSSVVGASVSWLACKDVCVLGSAELESRWSEVEVDPVFARWQSTLPEAWGNDDMPFSVSTTGGLSTGTLTVWLKWRRSPAAVEWFPDPPEGLVVEDIMMRTQGGLSRIDASIRRMAGATEVFETLPSVLAITEGHQQRHGWIYAVDLSDDNS